MFYIEEVFSAIKKKKKQNKFVIIRTVFEVDCQLKLIHRFLLVEPL